MTDILFACLSAVLLFLAFAVPFLVRRTTKRRQKYAEAAEIFHKKAEALASDPDTPSAVLYVLEAMNDLINDARGARFFLRVVFAKSRDDNARALKAEYDSEVAPFFRKRPELERAFSEASTAVFSAWAWNGRGVRGFVARRLYMKAVPMMDGQRLGGRIAVTSARHHDDHHHTGRHAHA